MAQILIETSTSNRMQLEELANKIGKDAQIFDAKNLNGSEIAKLIVENFPSYTTLIVTLVQLFKKKSVNLTIRKEGGEKIVNPTKDDAQEFLNKKDKDE